MKKVDDSNIMEGLEENVKRLYVRLTNTTGNETKFAQCWEKSAEKVTQRPT